MTPGIDFEIEKPLTPRECRRHMSRQGLLGNYRFFKRIAESVKDEDLQHLSIGSFPLSECKLRISRILPMRLYTLLSRLSGISIKDLSISLGVSEGRVHQILAKGQKALKEVRKICGDSAVDNFLNQHTTEILSALEVQVKQRRAEREESLARYRNPSPRNTSDRVCFYLLDGVDILNL